MFDLRGTGHLTSCLSDSEQEGSDLHRPQAHLPPPRGVLEGLQQGALFWRRDNENDTFEPLLQMVSKPAPLFRMLSIATFERSPERSREASHMEPPRSLLSKL